MPLRACAVRRFFEEAPRQRVGACAESRASENASRIASMQAAEKNIDRRLAELQQHFSQTRQTAIAEELMDIVTGFEALTKKR